MMKRKQHMDFSITVVLLLLQRGTLSPSAETRRTYFVIMHHRFNCFSFPYFEPTRRRDSDALTALQRRLEFIQTPFKLFVRCVGSVDLHASRVAYGSGSRPSWPVTRRSMVRSPAPPSVVESSCPSARHLTLTAPDELAVTLRG